tara:strand:+ start:1894 stop:3129 length:1236 start_codon:yes stop_codon:yes gene_type:complete
MNNKNLSILSKFKWYEKIIFEYEIYLKSKKIPVSKATKLAIILGWSIDHIYYNENWKNYYPLWIKDPKTGSPKKVKKTFLRKRSFFIENIFLMKKIYKYLKYLVLKITINLNFNFLQNYHKLLFWENIRFLIFKKLINKSDNKAKIEKELFLKKFEKEISDKGLFECLLLVLPNEFFDLKTEFGHLVLNARCERLIFPEMIKLINSCSSSYIIHHNHGSVSGWYISNFFDKKLTYLSDQIINWNIADKNSFTRYYIKPKNNNKRRIYWVTRANLNKFFYEMVPNIKPDSDNDLRIHFDDIFKVIKEFEFNFLLHPRGELKQYKKYFFKALSLTKFDPKKTSKNDIFIFDSINSSLIFYCLKFSIKFLIYETNIPKNTTENYKTIEKYLKKRNLLFQNDIKGFKNNFKKLNE